MNAINAMKVLTQLIWRLLKWIGPESDFERPKEALVEVRLVELLPPELPGWPSRYPKRRL